MNDTTAPAFDSLPAVLKDEAKRAWKGLADDDASLLCAHAPSAAVLSRILACSPFIARVGALRRGLLAELVRSGDLDRRHGGGEYAQRLHGVVQGVTAEADLLCALRWLRNRELVRIAWRDIGGAAQLDETLTDLSALADAMLEAALAWLHADLCAGLGTPVDERGSPQRLSVIAMGKLGARELNFSSDIDLMFVYSRGGETAGGRKPVSNQEFFDRLGRRLIRALDASTADGFVFRVDMRLRPFGDSGALTLSHAAMEAYYEAHARDWERYAMIKARVCAGDRAEGGRLLKTLQPFVYRRYLDFGALQSLREMKRLINTEVARAGMHNDVKKGAGGIREIEFIAQMFQLIRGGREPALRVRGTRAVLQELKRLRYLPAAAVDALLAAYEFLRTTEHRLQQIDDRQTQELPEDEAGRARVALGMGFESWEAFAAELQRHRDCVRRHFAQLLETPGAPSQQRHSTASRIDGLWTGTLDDEGVVETLRAAGFRDPEGARQEIEKLRGAHAIGRLGTHGQERLARLLPMILQTVAGRPNEVVALARIFRLAEAVARRSVYLSLLAEHPQALRQLARLVAASPWIADYIVRQPMLLDELIDHRTLYTPPAAAALETALRSEVAKHPAEDLEGQMNALRHFRHAEVLKVAAADLTGHLPLPEVSAHLSWIAEAVLCSTLDLAWRHLTARHGRPHYVVDGERRRAGFTIIAYGKLGGLELGYGSDLDLVFLHDSSGEGQMTDGERPVDNNVFFTRLGQRLIHLVATITPAGFAYEVDLRLRPNGAAGLLVSSLEAYGKYQREQAWTWEQQALVRARFVAGDAAIGGAFGRIRSEILGRRRDRGTLRRDILHMRERMRRELASREPGVFDLKQGEGGITDIEFMVQYGVLARAAEYHGLLKWTDNLRLLEVFNECGLLPAPDCVALREAYCAYRAETHRRALQELPTLVPESEFQEQRRRVKQLWQQFLMNGA